MTRQRIILRSITHDNENQATLQCTHLTAIHWCVSRCYLVTHSIATLPLTSRIRLLWVILWPFNGFIVSASCVFFLRLSASCLSFHLPYAVPDMTCNMFGEKLNLAQSINPLSVWNLCWLLLRGNKRDQVETLILCTEWFQLAPGLFIGNPT